MTFESDVCRVLGGKLGEVEERRVRDMERLRMELSEQTDARKRIELCRGLRNLREELECLQAIAQERGE